MATYTCVGEAVTSYSCSDDISTSYLCVGAEEILTESLLDLLTEGGVVLETEG